MIPVLYLVIPCYNEEEVLRETTRQLLERLKVLKENGKIAEDSRILYVNDGSGDKTWELISSLYEEHDEVSGLNLSRNRGHQNAVLAGLMYAKECADAVISLDADLQDDVKTIDKMMEEYHSGFDIVYGVRNSRKTDSFFKKNTAQAFYKFMRMMGVDIIYNHADFRLMSKRVLDELEHYKEVNLFLRGIVPLIGFPSTCVYYERHERFAGESKYPLRKMLSFAVNGITSFSTKPIRLITTLGFVICLVSVVMLIYSLASYFAGRAESGWSSLIVSIWALGGLQLSAIGIIGEYIGKMYLETKERPKFCIQDILDR